MNNTIFLEFEQSNVGASSNELSFEKFQPVDLLLSIKEYLQSNDTLVKQQTGSILNDLKTRWIKLLTKITQEVYFKSLNIYSFDGWIEWLQNITVSTFPTICD